MKTVDNILSSYVSDTSADNKVTSVPKSPNEIQRVLEQQISTVQGEPVNATIETKNVAIQAVKVPKESVISRKLVFEAIRSGEHNTLITTVKIGEPSKDEAEAAISFQLPIDIVSNVHQGIIAYINLFVVHVCYKYSDTIKILSNQILNKESFLIHCQ